MQLAEVSIRRPVFATVLSLLVLLIGAVSFNKLSIREYPKIDEPVVTVSVRYAGASAEVMESQVTKPLEDSIAGIDAVDVITSISRAEQTQISVRFRLEKDADTAAAEVRDRTSRVRNRLPQAIDEPVIAKVEADAFPVIWLSFTSDTLNPLQINDLVNRIVKPRLQTVTGAADVRIFGERKYAMRVWLDPDRLAAYKMTVQDAEDAIVVIADHHDPVADDHIALAGGQRRQAIAARIAQGLVIALVQIVAAFPGMFILMSMLLRLSGRHAGHRLLGQTGRAMAGLGFGRRHEGERQEQGETGQSGHREPPAGWIGLFAGKAHRWLRWVAEGGRCRGGGQGHRRPNFVMFL